MQDFHKNIFSKSNKTGCQECWLHNLCKTKRDGCFMMMKKHKY
jgi:hypothetical protein